MLTVIGSVVTSWNNLTVSHSSNLDHLSCLETLVIEECSGGRKKYIFSCISIPSHRPIEENLLMDKGSIRGTGGGTTFGPACKTFKRQKMAINLFPDLSSGIPVYMEQDTSDTRNFFTEFNCPTAELVKSYN